MDRRMLAVLLVIILGGAAGKENSSTIITGTIPTVSFCGGIFTETSFTLRSPSHPADYPNGLSCEWRIVRQSSDICGLELTFVKFDLEPSDNCSYDYLQVEQNKLCGRIGDGAVRVFMFAEKETTLRFISDEQNSRSGFNIRAKQIKTCSPKSVDDPTDTGLECNRTFYKKEFFLRSPNYPLNYSDSSNCSYKVSKHNKRVCALKVTFANFDIEDSVNCKSDYFAVEDKKFCGKLEDATTQTFPFQGTEKLLSFKSDSSVSGPGFFAHIQQEECDARALQSPDECSQDIKTVEFELRSPGYPNQPYKNDLRCRYRLTRARPSMCSLLVTILDFKLQEGEVCENDYLQIAEERLCGTIARGMTRSYSFGNSDTLLLNFDTDGSVTNKGFYISGVQTECNSTSGRNSTDRRAQSWDCDRTIRGREDQIQSPAFPDTYPPDADCRWMVIRADPKFCELEITIHSLHIQVGESCQFDYLEVDGHRFCGSTTAGNKRIFTFKSEQIVVHFHSDSSVNDRGFEVTLRQRDCPTSTTPSSPSCDQVFDSKQFILASPNHPSDYDNGLNCRYLIRRSDEEICRLEMEFLRFDVESSSDCEYDYLDIDGERICGLLENTTRTYLFQDFEKQLMFHSDSGTSRPGFMIRVNQVDCNPPATEVSVPPSKPCDRQFQSTTFEIQSDNFPKNYDSYLRCTYTVARAHAGVCAVELTFISFDVEASDDCQYDYLKIQDERLCGIYPTNLKRIIPFEGHEVSFEFRSDGATSRPGFHIRGQQMDCAPSTARSSPPLVGENCDMTFNNVSGTFYSPNFPEQYPGPRRCTYKFVALADRCRVVIQFLEFSLQAENALCEKDFLKINGIKYCGPQLIGQKRTITFFGHPREVNITFESDATISDKGFYAVYRQLTCSTATGRSPARRINARSCNRLYASLAFSILSPDHPDNYPSDVDCKYTIRRLGPRICRLKLSFRAFDTESSEGCEYDYLEIDGKKICGTLPGGHIQMVEFKDYQTIFTFHSDSANTRPGFVIKVEQEECPDVQQSPKPHPEPPGKQQPQFPPQSQQHHFPSQKQQPHYPPQKFQPHFEVPLVEPPIENPYVYPSPPHHHPHHHPQSFDYEHLVDYPVYGETAIERTLQVHNQNCDRLYQSPEFEIRSVNFPMPYPNGLNCRYLVRKASEDICWVKLVFIRFDLEPSDDCHFDYLSINGKRICGTLPEDEIRAYLFNSDEISMYFRSDGANAHRGFLIRGEQLQCNAKKGQQKQQPTPKNRTALLCDRSFEREIFVVQSPNFPDPYPPSTECNFSIRRANRYICGLKLTMLAFDLENQADCNKDYLEIEGERLCGPVPTRTSRMIPFPGETLSMKFRSDIKIERPGFSILVHQTEDCQDIKRSASSAMMCAHEYFEEVFLLQSPSFPDDYPAESTCEFLIHRKSRQHCRIELRIISFDLEEGVDGKCEGDYLELPTGFRLCGQLAKDHTVNFSFVNESALLMFRSDSSTQRPGFSIQVRQMRDCGEVATSSPVEDTCGGLFVTEEFSLKSPGFPHDYPHAANCVYVVKKFSESVCALELKFAHFDVEKGPDCSYDHLDIGHKTICGQLPSGFTRDIPFPGSEMKFIFRSDRGTTKSGFAIKVRQSSECGTTWKPVTPPSRMCDHCLKESRGHVISPDYPANYPPGLQCAFHLQRAKGFCGLDIFFHDFSIKESEGCLADALIVNGERLCGDKLKGKLKKIDFPIGDSNEVLLEFETDEEGSSQGFHAEYRQIPCRGYPWKQGQSQWVPSNVSDWNSTG